MAKAVTKGKPTNKKSGRTVEKITTFQQTAQIDNFRIIAFPYKGRATIVDQSMTSFTWSEDARTAAIEADMSFVNIGDFARKTLAPGTWIYPQYIHPTTKRWTYLDPPFYIWERDLTDVNDLTANITAFDIVSFLQRQAPQPWLFRKDKAHKKGWTASQVATKILTDLNVRSRLFKTKTQIPYLSMEGHTPYEAIVKAYTRDRQITGTRYRIQAFGNKVSVLPYVNQNRVWELSSGTNLISATWSESLEKKRTEIILLSANNQGIIRGVRQRSKDIQRYGTLREIVIFDREVREIVLHAVAKIMINLSSGLSSKVHIQAEGVLPLRAGDVVYASEKFLKLAGRFFVSSVSHEVTPGQHVMNIELSRTDIVPVLYPTRNELVSNKSKGKSPILGAKASVTGPNGVAWYPPLGSKAVEFKDRSNQGAHATGVEDWKHRSAVDIIPADGQESTVFASITGTFRNVSRGTSTKSHISGHQVSIEAEGGIGPSILYSGLSALEANVLSGKKISLGKPIGKTGKFGDIEQGIHFAVTSGKWEDKAGGVDPLPYVNPSDPDNQTGGPQSDVVGELNIPSTSNVAGTNALVNQLSEYLRTKFSPLKEFARFIVAEGQRTKTDPRLCVAISGAETSFGLTGNASNIHNAWGIGPGRSYGSWEEGIQAFYRSINGSPYAGARSIADIQKHWAPYGAANDPGGLNNNWLNNVTRIFTEIGGNANGPVKNA